MDLLWKLIALLSLAVLVAALLNPLRADDDAARNPRFPEHPQE
jgi:hypothetical protein